MFAPTFPDLQGLVSLARQGIDKPTLLRVLTDLYVQKLTHSAEEEHQYVELASRLVEAVDHATRKVVAERLKQYPRPPHPVLQRLEQLRLAVIAPVREVPPREALPPPPAAFAWTASANPPPRPALVLNAPLPAPSPPPSATFEWTVNGPPAASRTLTVSAPLPASPPLPVPPPPRRERHPQPASRKHPARELTDLFFAADAQERALLLLNPEGASPPPAFTLDPFMAADAVRRLEMMALLRKPDAFAALCAQFLSVTPARAALIVGDASGEPLLVAAKCLAAATDVLQRILQFLNPAIGHAAARVDQLTNLYDEMTRDSALRLLAMWQAADALLPPAAETLPLVASAPAPRPVHKPLHYNDEVPRARSLTAHAQRRIVKASERPGRTRGFERA